MWHLPLFFIDGTSQAHVPLALFLPSVVALSVVLAWLVSRTEGSVVAALLFHTAVNFWPSVVPVLPTDASDRAYVLAVALLVLLALLALAQEPRQGGKPWGNLPRPGRRDDLHSRHGDRISSQP
jgi:hypothetical protein